MTGHPSLVEQGKVQNIREARHTTSTGHSILGRQGNVHNTVVAQVIDNVGAQASNAGNSKPEVHFFYNPTMLIKYFRIVGTMSQHSYVCNLSVLIVC